MKDNDPFLGKQFETPTGSTLKVVSKVDGQTKYMVECSICSYDKELFPDGIFSSKGNLISGKIPCGCATQSNMSPRQKQILAKRKINSNENYTYIGFDCPDKDINSKSNVLFKCRYHGIKNVRYSNVMSGIGCRGCADVYRSGLYRLKDPYSKVIDICESLGYEFVGYPDGYINAFSRMTYICPIHGINNTTYNAFVSLGSKCVGCYGKGYNENSPGYFYIFKYKISGKEPVYKFGITNRNCKKRSNEHISGLVTEICEEVFSHLFVDGSIPKQIESEIKKKHKGVCDWLTSGNTETINEEHLLEIISIVEERISND